MQENIIGSVSLENYVQYKDLETNEIETLSSRIGSLHSPSPLSTLSFTPHTCSLLADGIPYRM